MARFGSTVISLDEAERLFAQHDPSIPDDTEIWVDPNKKIFTQRMAAAKEADRRYIRGILADSMRRGESGQQAAGRIEDFLTPLSSRFRNGNRTLTNRHLPIPDQIPLNPRSGVGSSRLRTLARTETTRAHGLATIEAAELNPFVAGVKWNLSGSHPRPDECDGFAHGHSRNLPRGVYTPGDVPGYPTHPNCLCYLSQEVIRKNAGIVRELLRRERLPLRDAPFSTASNVDEAQIFAKEVLGVDANYIDDLQTANIVNRAMWDAKSQGFPLPDNTLIRPFNKTDDLPTTYAQYNPNIDTLELNSLRKDFFVDDTIARREHDLGWFAAKNRIGLIHHELGHINHFKNNPRSYATTYHSIQRGTAAELERQVSQYANSNSQEFMAEVFAGRFAGNKYSPEVDKLYDTFFNARLHATDLDGAIDELLDITEDAFRDFPIAATKPISRLRDLPNLNEARWQPKALRLTETDIDLDTMRKQLLDFMEDLDQSDVNKIEAAVQSYSSGFSDDMNRWLRAGQPEDYQPKMRIPGIMGEIRKMDEDMQILLDRTRTSEELIVYRGFDVRGPERPLWEPQVGDDIFDRGYNSTSVYRGWLDTSKWRDTDTHLEIFVPKNSKGVFIDPISTFGTDEGEFLINKNSWFSVAGRQGDHILLEHIPEGRPFQIPISRTRPITRLDELPEIPNFHTNIDRINSDDFDRLDELGEQAEKLFTKGPKNLGNAIESYTFGEGEDLNRWLRLDKPKQFDQVTDISISDIRKMDETLEEFFEKIKSSENLIVLRGIDIPETHPLWLPRVGEDILEKGYSSTSVYDDWFDSSLWGEFSTRLELFIPKGSKGAYIDPLSTFSGEQGEFLLNKNSWFNIAGRRGDRILLEHIPEGRPFQIPVARARAGEFPYKDLPEGVTSTNPLTLAEQTTMKLIRQIDEAKRTADTLANRAEKLVTEADKAKKIREAAEAKVKREADKVTRAAEKAAKAEETRLLKEVKVLEKAIAAEKKKTLGAVTPNVKKLTPTEKKARVTRKPEEPPTEFREIKGFAPPRDSAYRRRFSRERTYVPRPFTRTGSLDEWNQILDTLNLHDPLPRVKPRSYVPRIQQDPPSKYPRIEPGSFEWNMLAHKLPRNPSRSQLRFIRPSQRELMVKQVNDIQDFWLTRPDQKRLHDMAMHPDRYPRRYLPSELEALGLPKTSETRLANARRRKWNTVDRLGRPKTVYETESEFRERLARSQLGGPDPYAALRTPPDVLSREAQKKLVNDIIDAVIGPRFEFRPQGPLVVPRRKQGIIIPRVDRTIIIPRKGPGRGIIIRNKLRDLPWYQRTGPRQETRAVVPIRGQIIEFRTTTLAPERTLEERVLDAIKRYRSKNDYKSTTWVDDPNSWMLKDVAPPKERKRLPPPRSEFDRLFRRFVMGYDDRPPKPPKTWPPPPRSNFDIALRKLFGIDIPSEVVKPVRLEVPLFRREVLRGRTVIDVDEAGEIITVETALPVAQARPGGFVVRDILEGNTPPEMQTRLNGIDEGRVLANIRNEGLDIQTIIRDNPVFPFGKNLREAEEIARLLRIDDLDLGMQTAIHRQLYKTTLNEVNNGMFEQIMRGEPVPKKVAIMPRDEFSMTYGGNPDSQSLATFFTGQNRLLFDARQTSFWGSDNYANQQFNKGSFASPMRLGAVIHEIGHWDHYAKDNIKYVDMAKKFNLAEWRNTAQELDIENRLSRYAGSKPTEFVAEMYSGIRTGRLDPERDADLFELLAKVLNFDIP